MYLGDYPEDIQDNRKGTAELCCAGPSGSKVLEKDRSCAELAGKPSVQPPNAERSDTHTHAHTQEKKEFQHPTA